MRSSASLHVIWAKSEEEEEEGTFCLLPFKRLKEAFRGQKSTWVIETTEFKFEVRSDLGGHRQPLKPFFGIEPGSGTSSQPRMAPFFLLHSLVVKVSDFGARGPRFKSHLWQSKNVTNVLIL